MTALSNTPDEQKGNEARSSIIAERKEAFTSATSQYFDLLSSIDVGLRRQINALDDADILPTESSWRDSQTTQSASSPLAAGGNPARQASASKGSITGGGLGSLDVGWLNSRNDKVGKEKEARLWEEAAAFLETRSEIGSLTDNEHQTSDDPAMESSQSLAQASNGASQMDLT